MVSTISEETYDELHMLLREAMMDGERDQRIVIASGDDLFNQQGESLYAIG